MSTPNGLLARGPWDPDRIEVRWRPEHYEPAAEASAAADAAIAALRDRGSPSHDGLSGRLAGFDRTPDGLVLEMQPVRWALRLLDASAEGMAALCVTRDADGRWLAGRRSSWLASWAGRWALGAGGAVEVDESPVHTLARELEEEWSVTPERLTAEALVRLPNDLVLLIGLAHLPPGAEVVPDDEHDAFAWWPASVQAWPAEADEPLRRIATLLDAGR